MNQMFPLTRDLVLIGGGHTHALVLRNWGMTPLAGVRVTVINPGPTAPYSGMLPGFVAGHYDRDTLDIDLVRLARFAGARLICGAVSAIDRAKQQITVPGRPPIGYDVASLDIGITSEMPSLPGFAEHAVPAKPLGNFATRWDAFRSGADPRPVAVIGGGVAGAELSMAIAYALRQIGRGSAVHLIDRGPVLEALGQTARAKMLEALAASDVSLTQNAEISQVTATGVALADGTVIQAGFVVGAAGAKPHDWQAEIGLDLQQGYVAVGATLQSSDPAIFAVGDCAHLTHDPPPKAGVFAVREAPVLFDNMRAVLSDGALRNYKPQSDYLKLISLGEKSALAERFGTARSGPWLWRWKDHIDRKFMDKFTDLPAMPSPRLPRTHALDLTEDLAGKPMCGGCGAKVGRGALRDALSILPVTARDDVEVLPGDDAAILMTGGTRQVITTDHLRGFSHDPVIVTRIAALHALGDIWAMGATPQAATAQIILPRMSTELQRRSMAEIMVSAQEVFADAGAAIVGGHSSMGAELTIGFTVTGLCDRPPITLRGAKPGDSLILTKPVGSGVVLAAEMAGRVPGADYLAALQLMQSGQGKAAHILRSAHAMTDVTGFGLAGHLAGLCEASGVGALVRMSDVPLFPGAHAHATQGVVSTIYADNRASLSDVTAPGSPLGMLMFDPQTTGGLLAAVPVAKVASLLKSLQKAGYGAAHIGEISTGSGVQFR